MQKIIKTICLLALILSINSQTPQQLANWAAVQIPPPLHSAGNNIWGYCLTGKYYSEREPTLNSWCAYNCSPACAPGTSTNPFPNCAIMNQACAPKDPSKLCNCFNYYDTTESNYKCYPKSTYANIVGMAQWCVYNCCPTCQACQATCDCLNQPYNVPTYAPGSQNIDESGFTWSPTGSDIIKYL